MIDLLIIMEPLPILMIFLSTVCLASAAGGWDEYLDDGIPAIPIDDDEVDNARQFLVLTEPTLEDCDKFNLIKLLKENSGAEQLQTRKEVTGRRTIEFCKKQLETDVTNALAKLDDELKERLELFVKNMVDTRGGGDFKSIKFEEPDRSIIESILILMERRGSVLSQIKTRDEFDKYYGKLVKDCRKLDGKLVGPAYVYSVFLDNETFRPDPTVAEWTRNAIVCAKFAINPLLGYEAYRVLQERFSPIEQDQEDMPIKDRISLPVRPPKQTGLHFSIRIGSRA